MADYVVRALVANDELIGYTGQPLDHHFLHWGRASRIWETEERCAEYDASDAVFSHVTLVHVQEVLCDEGTRAMAKDEQR